MFDSGDGPPTKELTGEEALEIFSGKWTDEDPVSDEVEIAFYEQLGERYAEVMDAHDALRMKSTDGSIGEIQDTGTEIFEAVLEICQIGARHTEGDTSDVPESLPELFELSDEERSELFERYFPVALEEAPTEAYEFLHEIEENSDEFTAKEDRVEAHYEQWFEMLQLTIFYKGLVASYMAGYMPFDIARAVAEHEDDWWEGKEPESDMSELLPE